MKQKISIFSFGMLRLELRLQEIQQELDVGLSTYYDWHKNRITIVGEVAVETLTKEECKWLIDQIKSKGGIYPDGKPIAGSASLYADLFDDIGFAVESKPERLEERLDEIISIRVGNVRFAGSGSLSCESDLLSSRAMYSARL